MSVKRTLSALLYNDSRDKYEKERNIDVVGSPSDSDWNRWAMLHSSKTNEGDELYRLYCFQHGTNDTLYQFGYNEKADQYEFGYKSDKVLKIKGVSPQLDTATFAMLHDGENYRLYFLDFLNPHRLHQFVYDGFQYVIEASNPIMDLVGLSPSVDTRRMAMASDNGISYELYLFEQGKKGHLLHAMYEEQHNTYDVTDRIPLGVDLNEADITSFSLLQDGEDYWCYFLNWLDE
ncbi:MAG: hypothetical protein ACPGJS_15860 [Flammeovirgaceae bacterium]